MLILTGFEPFSSFKINPAWEIARALESDEVKSIRVPVSYRKVRNMTREILEKYEPEAVLSLGLADGRGQLSVEMVALNIMDSTMPDNDGYAPKNERIFADGKLAYLTTVPAERILERWQMEGIPGYLSYHAGTYVCNALFYSFLYHAEKLGLDIPVGFIHLPSSENLVMKRKNRPYVEMKTMEKAIKLAVEIISRRPSSP